MTIIYYFKESPNYEHCHFLVVPNLLTISKQLFGRMSVTIAGKLNTMGANKGFDLFGN